MTGQTFAQALADSGRIPNTGTTIASNPEQSKHLETTRVKMEELEVDLVNLRSEKYTAESRIPIMVYITSSWPLTRSNQHNGFRSLAPLQRTHKGAT